jgi:hypothetical protein
VTQKQPVNSCRAVQTKLPLRARPSDLRRQLGRARERLGDRLLTWLTVLLAFLTFDLAPKFYPVVSSLLAFGLPARAV